MAENELIRCPCSVWPTVWKPPAKVIYEPVKRNTGRGLEGWISGLGIATIFHHYQAIPGGLVKHLVIPHSPVRPSLLMAFFFLNWDKIESTLRRPLDGEPALLCYRVFTRSFSFQHWKWRLCWLKVNTTDEFSLFYKQILIEVLHKSVDFSICSYLHLTILGEPAHKAAHKQTLTAPLLWLRL